MDVPLGGFDGGGSPCHSFKYTLDRSLILRRNCNTFNCSVPPLSFFCLQSSCNSKLKPWMNQNYTFPKSNFITLHYSDRFRSSAETHPINIFSSFFQSFFQCLVFLFKESFNLSIRFNLLIKIFSWFFSWLLCKMQCEFESNDRLLNGISEPGNFRPMKISLEI